MPKEHPTIVTVYDPIAGFKTVLLTWNEEYELYEPCQTGDFAYGKPEEAEVAAKTWAMVDSVRFVPYKGKYTEALFVCRGCMGLFNNENDIYCASCRYKGVELCINCNHDPPRVNSDYCYSCKKLIDGGAPTDGNGLITSL